MTEAIGKRFEQPTVTLETPKVPSNVKKIAKLVATFFAGIIGGGLGIITPVLVGGLVIRGVAKIVGIDNVQSSSNTLFNIFRNVLIVGSFFAAGKTMFNLVVKNLSSPERVAAIIAERELKES